MVNRSLGRTELMVSPLSVGSGGGPEKDICRLVHHALDLGINLFDTSRGYGDSELILGSALKGIPRDRYLISMKLRLDAGVLWNNAAKRKYVIETAENSLRRLQVSEVGILLVQGWPHRFRKKF